VLVLPAKLRLLSPGSPRQSSASSLPRAQEPNPCAAQQLRDLREQYARLQDDYKSKLCEVSRLRCDSEALRREAREAKEERERVEIKLVDVQERLRVTECERNELLGKYPRYYIMIASSGPSERRVTRCSLSKEKLLSRLLLVSSSYLSLEE
jgi:chromosome segregation ATPase